MTPEEHERWNQYYIEALERDALMAAYKQADLEDERKAHAEEEKDRVVGQPDQADEEQVFTSDES